MRGSFRIATPAIVTAMTTTGIPLITSATPDCHEGFRTSATAATTRNTTESNTPTCDIFKPVMRGPFAVRETTGPRRKIAIETIERSSGQVTARVYYS